MIVVNDVLAIGRLVLRRSIYTCWSRLRYPPRSVRARLRGELRPMCEGEPIAEGDLARFLEESSLAKRWGYMTPSEIDEEEAFRTLYDDPPLPRSMRYAQPIDEALRILGCTCIEDFRRATQALRPNRLRRL